MDLEPSLTCPSGPIGVDVETNDDADAGAEKEEE
jgi:hypothetical protein